MKRAVTSIGFVGFVGSLLLGVLAFRGARSGIVPEMRIPGTLINVQAQDRGCSVASLHGTYAFRRTGVNNVVGGPIAQIGIALYSGDGTRGLIRTARSTNGEIRDWTDFPTNGSYTVDPDCTGSLFDANGAKSNNLVVLDGGKRFFLLSVAPGTITTEEGERVEVAP